MYRRWWKKGISWENFMTRKVKFFTISIGLLYSWIFFPLICVIKCFMNLMLLHWILVKFCMEGQINRLGPYDYSWNIVCKAFVKMLIWLALSIVLCSHFCWMVIQWCHLWWYCFSYMVFMELCEGGKEENVYIELWSE